MKTSRKNQLRSIAVLIIAALLLELITAVQYFSTRRGITMQMTEMAQRDLSATNRTAELKKDVEETMAQILPDIERFTANQDKDSLRLIIREMLGKEQQVVGVDYCRLVGADGHHDGIYIYKEEEQGGLTEQVIDFDYTKRSWYSRAIDSDGFWSEPYMSNYKVVLMCTFSRAVRNAQGETVAVLGADVPMKELSALASQLYDNQKRSLLPVILLQILGLGILAFIIHRYVRGIRRLHDVNKEKERIAGELSVAQGIQEAMKPKVSPSFAMRDDIDLHAFLTPAREVGGDFCDFSIRDEKLFFCIGDVSGKGIPASLVMAVSRTLFRNVTAHTAEPDHIVETMNKRICDGNDNFMFVTLFVGVLDLQTGHLSYCNAGHDAPYVQGELLPCIPNLPIGVKPTFQYVNQEADIASGVNVFLYTDGLTEAKNADNQFFGQQRITDIVAAFEGSPQELIETMTAAVHQFVGDYEQSDDLTMLAFKISM